MKLPLYILFSAGQMTQASAITVLHCDKSLPQFCFAAGRWLRLQVGLCFEKSEGDNLSSAELADSGTEVNSRKKGKQECNL